MDTIKEILQLIGDYSLPLVISAVVLYLGIKFGLLGYKALENRIKSKVEPKPEVIDNDGKSTSFPLVLVVDDESIAREIAREILCRDYKVMEASNGKEALDLLSRVAVPDIILLDIHMDIMDGYATIRNIQENPNIKDIPILFVTATEDSSDISRALRCGAIDFIVKPYHPDLLLKRLGNYIELSKYRKQSNK